MIFKLSFQKKEKKRFCLKLIDYTICMGNYTIKFENILSYHSNIYKICWCSRYTSHNSCMKEWGLFHYSKRKIELYNIDLRRISISIFYFTFNNLYLQPQLNKLANQTKVDLFRRRRKRKRNVKIKIQKLGINLYLIFIVSYGLTVFTQRQIFDLFD